MNKNDNMNKTFAANCDCAYATTDSNKTTYRCAICDKAYDTIDERVSCETKCLAARKKAQAELEKKRLEEKKTTRKAEIEKKYKELSALVKDYCKELGESRYFEDDIPTPYKLIVWWF